MAILPSIAILAVLFHFLPAMRKEMYFGVRVPAAYRESAHAASVIRSYRLLNLCFAAIAAATTYWGIEQKIPWLAGVAQAAYGLGMLAVAWRLRRSVLAHAVPASNLRTASLSSEQLPSWIWVLCVLPVLILGATAWYLAANWPEIPDRFPIHWGADGKANRWTTKTFKGVFGSLLIGASTIALCYGVFVATLTGARRDGDSRLLRAFAVSMSGVMTAVSLLISTLALKPLTGNAEMPIPSVVIALLPLTLIAISILPMWRVSQEAGGASDDTPDECWHGGAYYYNRNDSALMVRNRIGMGYSPNFGHRAIQVGFPLLILQLMAVIFYVTR